MYEIQFTDAGLADVKSLPKGVRNSLKKIFRDRISVNPYESSRELNEPLTGWRSFHWQKYRIVYKVYDDVGIVAVAAVGERLPQSRSDVYRRLEALAAEGKLADKLLSTLRGF